MQVLVGLQARGIEAFIPALVGYARTPGAVPELRAFFAQYPRLEPYVLGLLATDPANADLVLALATVPKPNPDWRGTLVSSLASAGQYSKAFATWARLSGVRSRPALFNPGFADLAAPPPFNWTFPLTTEGVAEPNGKGGVEVLYYGRTKAVLASQLLILPRGPVPFGDEDRRRVGWGGRNPLDAALRQCGQGAGRPAAARRSRGRRLHRPGRLSGAMA